MCVASLVGPGRSEGNHRTVRGGAVGFGVGTQLCSGVSGASKVCCRQGQPAPTCPELVIAKPTSFHAAERLGVMA